MIVRGGRLGVPARLRSAVFALAVGASVALLALTPVMAGRVMMHQCVTAGGGVDVLGLRFAVLRDVADCPAGSYGVGTASTGAVLLLSVAVPALMVHLVLAAGGAGLSAALVRFGRAVATVVAAVVSRAPTDRAVTHPQLRPALVRPSACPVVRRTFVVSIPTRGPPLQA